MDEILQTILVPGSVSAALVLALLWLLRGWIKTRLTHEYDVKLERVKASLEDELERLRTLLQQSLHVTKAQFDMEFESCKSLWANMSKLVDLTARLINSHVDYGISGNQSDFEKWAEEADAAFFASHKVAIEVAPFMPANIKEVASTLNGSCKHEIDYYFDLIKPGRPNLAEFDTKEVHKAMKEAKAALVQDYRKLEETIRVRLASMGGLTPPKAAASS